MKNIKPILMKSASKCSLCGSPGLKIFDYILCNSCKAKLGLFTDDTITKHIKLYNKAKKTRSYADEARYRLNFIEKDYIKKRIKLLHILERLEQVFS